MNVNGKMRPVETFPWFELGMEIKENDGGVNSMIIY
jgi:hypothetical protein